MLQVLNHLSLILTNRQYPHIILDLVYCISIYMFFYPAGSNSSQIKHKYICILFLPPPLTLTWIPYMKFWGLAGMLFKERIPLLLPLYIFLNNTPEAPPPPVCPACSLSPRTLTSTHSYLKLCLNSPGPLTPLSSANKCRFPLTTLWGRNNKSTAHLCVFIFIVMMVPSENVFCLIVWL